MPREVSNTIAQKFRSRVQAKSQNSDPKVDLWLGRPVTPMTTNDFFERQIIYTGSNLTKTDIAVRHMSRGRQSDRLFLAYITGGTARIKSAVWKVKMDTHVWIDEPFMETADDVAIAFDADLERLDSGNEEFITESSPWVFWCAAGVLYGRKLDDPTGTVTLATSNVSAVSAVRASWSDLIEFDFGLMVFFVIAGSVYYRQYIQGEWYDAVQVPDGMLSQSRTYTDVSVTRTWDYRVVVQAIDSNGTIYEAYTQYGGMGTRNQDHIEVKKFYAEGTNIGVRYLSAKNGDTDVVNVSTILGDAVIHSTLVPNIIEAYNTPNLEEDWGKIAVFVFDVNLDAARVMANYSCFSIVDSVGNVFVATSAVLSDDRRTVTLTFGDFNAARGVCKAKFTGNGMRTCAETVMEDRELSFTPENLVPPPIDPPAPTVVWNSTPDGSEVRIEFSEQVTSFLSNANAAFTLEMDEFNYIPEGILEEKVRIVESVSYLAGVSQDLNLDDGTYDGTEFSDGALHLGFDR